MPLEQHRADRACSRRETGTPLYALNTYELKDYRRRLEQAVGYYMRTILTPRY